MGRKLSILLAVIVICTIVTVVVLFGGGFVNEVIDQADNSEVNILTLVNKSYENSAGILTIDLQNVGDSLNSVKKEDFVWYMNGHGMKPINSITFPNSECASIESGDIIQLELIIGKDLSGKRIKLVFRGGFEIVITVP